MLEIAEIRRSLESRTYGSNGATGYYPVVTGSKLLVVKDVTTSSPGIFPEDFDAQCVQTHPTKLTIQNSNESWSKHGLSAVYHTVALTMYIE
eukprot:822835-Amorphochlora_amoeboformis.AAC.1